MYNLEEKDLDELYELLAKYEKFLKYAKLFGGKIAVGDKSMNQNEIEEIVEEIEIEIAIKESN